MTTQRWKRGGLRFLAVLAVAMVVLAGTVSAVPVAPDKVYGTVTDQNGDAVSGVTVQAVYDGEVLVETTTESDGYYELKIPDPDDGESGETVTVQTTGSATTSDDSATIQWDSGAVVKENLEVEVPEQTTTPPSGGTGDGEEPGGQPGSGGGGGASGEAPGAGVKSIAKGISGNQPELALSGGMPIQSVGFTSQAGLSASVSVEELSGPPGDTPPGLQFVAGADITFTMGDSDDVDTVRLGVERDRVDEIGVTVDQLAIYHYDDQHNEWEALETSVVSEGDGEVVLEAPSAGFSAYAIFAQQAETTTTTQPPTTTTQPPADTTTQPPADTTTQPPSDTTTTTSAGPTGPSGGGGPGPLLIGGIIVVLLALGAAAYLVYRE